MELTRKESLYSPSAKRVDDVLATLDVSTILRNASKPEEFKTNFQRRIRDYLEVQHKNFNYYKFRNTFAKTVVVTGDKDNFISLIKFNYEEFVSNFKAFLNVPSLSNDDPDFILKMHSKIEELKRVKTRKELSEKFPLIYEDYEEGIKYYKEIETLRDFGTDPISYQKAHLKEKNYYACGLRYGLSLFIKEQSQLYENMLASMENIFYYTNNKPIYGKSLLGIDTDRFELYVAYEYYKQAESLKEDDPKRLLYLDLVGKYLLSYKDADISYIDNKTNEEISYTDLYQKYLTITSKVAAWEFLPAGEVVRKPAEESDDKKHQQDLKKEKLDEPVLGELDLTDPETIKELTGAEVVGESENMNLYKANKDKVTFYQNSGYLGTAVGVKLNKGYTAFIYPNGYVVMDLIAPASHISEAIGNGIYVVKASEFTLLSRLSKNALRSMKDKRVFLYHNGSWQERLDKIIKSEGTPEEIEAANDLIIELTNKKR